VQSTWVYNQKNATEILGYKSRGPEVPEHCRASKQGSRVPLPDDSTEHLEFETVLHPHRNVSHQHHLITGDDSCPETYPRRKGENNEINAGAYDSAAACSGGHGYAKHLVRMRGDGGCLQKETSRTPSSGRGSVGMGKIVNIQGKRWIYNTPPNQCCLLVIPDAIP
jgi:hypothetical protein